MRLLITITFSCLVAFCQTAPRPIHGGAIDAATQKPIADAWVNAGAEIVKTDIKGEFQFNTAATSIELRARGYNRVTVPAENEMHVPLSSLRIRGLYMSFWAVSSQTMRAGILETAAKAHLNAVVIDVKGDLGRVAFRTTIPLVVKAGANRIITIPDAPGLIAGLHKRGLYAIARIVAFKDSPLA